MNFFPNSLEIWNQTWNVKVEVHKICMACFVLGKKHKANRCELWNQLVFFACSLLTPSLCTTHFKLKTLQQRFCLHGWLFFFSPETQSEVRRLIKLLFISVFLCFIFYITINLWEIVNKIYSEEKLTSIPNTYMFKHC